MTHSYPDNPYPTYATQVIDHPAYTNQSPEPYDVNITVTAPTSGTATASLVLAFFSLFGGAFLLAIPPVIGIFLGMSAMKHTRHGYRGGHGLAVAGVMLNVLSLVPVLVFAALVFTGTIGGS